MGLGAVCSQEDHSGTESSVAYYSKSLTKEEKNYSTTELECLAVVSLPFRIITDQGNFMYLDGKMKNSASCHTMGINLQLFVYEIIHRAGSNHGNADGLSPMLLLP